MNKALVAKLLLAAGIIALLATIALRASGKSSATGLTAIGLLFVTLGLVLNKKRRR